MLDTNDCNCQHDDCGVTKTLQMIGSKWTMHILHHLLEGTNRFGQLQKALHPISPRTLSPRLSELEHCGIITKKVFAEIPLHVEYSLTKKGHSLNEIFDQISTWGKKI